MKTQEKSGNNLESGLERLAGRLREKEITLPTDLLGAGLFLILAVVILILTPGQVPVSEADVVNGRQFPTMLMWLMIACCALLLIQNLIKLAKKEPLHTCTINLLTEVKALIILGILVATYLICRWTDLFVTGAVFCAVAFLVYFRCKKKLYYGITVGMAVLIWAAFRFALGVRF